NSVRILL
ncbi:myosin heavy chain form B domain protein, partial [Chlamydia psittaci 84-8471/1]